MCKHGEEEKPAKSKNKNKKKNRYFYYPWMNEHRGEAEADPPNHPRSFTTRISNVDSKI